MDKNNLTELEALHQKVFQLEESCQKLKSLDEVQKNEIKVLKATIVHFENSFFHKMRDVYTKYKFKFKRKVSDIKASENSILTFFKILRRVTLKIAKVLFKKAYKLVTRKEFHPPKVDDYKIWREINMPKESDLLLYKKVSGMLKYQPLISIILPVYNPPVKYFEMTIQSVLDQLYTNWELCISDDNSTNIEVKEIIEKYRAKDKRIKVVYRTSNGHISANSNSALSLATGEFVALLDHDDLLSKDALFQIANVLDDNNSIDFIYTDEDKVNDDGQFTDPHFKPAFCPDNLLSRNYITHLAVIRHDIVKEIGGFREGFEGSQDFDLFLRVVEQTKAIHHIPKVLYHWRIHPGSTAAASENDIKPYAFVAGRKAIMETLEKRGEPAEVSRIGALPGFYSIKYHLKKEEKISIVIPTKNAADILETCIDSIFEKSTYRNFEIILLDNNSDESSLFDLVKKYTKQYPEQFKCIKCTYPFNYSKLMNDGVIHADGEYILLLNNDTEVITPNWMELMMGQAQRKSIGCVGVKLLFFNDTIQHAGVIIGLGGIAGHCFEKYKRDELGYYAFLKTSSNYSAVTAACLMVRKSVFLEVEGFSESLAVEFNDVDFCLKVKEKGYNNIYIPDVELYHYESLTRGHPLLSGESMKRHVREVDIMKSKWQKYIKDDPCYSPNLSLYASDFRIKLNA